VIISLSVWHAAHRLRVLAHDFGIRADGPVAMVLYALAGAATLLAGILLALIQPA
jgi:fumarate reductase subunit D